MTRESSDGRQLLLYVRSLVPRGGRRRQIDVQRRLETLERNGAIDGYEVVVCGRQLPASPSAARTDVGASLASDVEVFREWARRNDCSLGQTLSERTVDHQVTDESYRAVEWPQLVLGEYHNGDLETVTPVDTGSEILTVKERLDEIEADETATAFTPVERAQESGPKRIQPP